MGLVTANIRVKNVPLRRAFIEHTDPTGVSSLGWYMTDENGSFTIDAGLFFNSVDIKIHCQNSVVQVLNGSFAGLPIDIHVSVGNGGRINIEHSGHNDVVDNFRILAKCQVVYDAVWRQFRPYNQSNRGDFPLGRHAADLEHVYKNDSRIQLSYPDGWQSTFPAMTSFTEPSPLTNSFPMMHVKSRTMEPRIFEEDAAAAFQDPSAIPHEFGHAMHFSAVSSNTRANFESQYLSYLVSHASNPGHDVSIQTSPNVAFVEAVGIFSERFFFFKQLVHPELEGVPLRQAFFNDELGAQTLATKLNSYVSVGAREGGVVTPALTRGKDVEGNVYGAIYLDFASHVGLREAVGLVLDGQATNTDEFCAYVMGRGNDSWTAAIKEVRHTWGI